MDFHSGLPFFFGASFSFEISLLGFPLWGSLPLWGPPFGVPPPLAVPPDGNVGRTHSQQHPQLRSGPAALTPFRVTEPHSQEAILGHGDPPSIPPHPHQGTEILFAANLTPFPTNPTSLKLWDPYFQGTETISHRSDSTLGHGILFPNEPPLFSGTGPHFPSIRPYLWARDPTSRPWEPHFQSLFLHFRARGPYSHTQNLTSNSSRRSQTPPISPRGPPRTPRTPTHPSPPGSTR